MGRHVAHMGGRVGEAHTRSGGQAEEYQGKIWSV
jgi:hypothetical protein